MTFSAKVKSELCRELPQSRCCCIAECYGILLYSSSFTADEIRIITSNDDFARFLPRLFRRAFNVSFDSIGEKKTASSRRTFLIHEPDKLQTILDRFGYDTSHLLIHHVNLGILEENCCKISFLRGAFLAGGSVTDPDKRYHLEFSTDHISVSREVCTMLRELGFDPREAVRKNSRLLYFKQNSAIEELLSFLGAGISSMDMINAKIEKGMTNSINRKVNCDAANVKKAVETAQQQIRAIRLLEKKSILSTLPEKLQQTAHLRLDNPSETSAELAAMHNPPVSKSCVNHRLQAIIARAEELNSDQ